MRDLIAFPDESRIWIYQSVKPFYGEEQERANQQILDFVRDWTSHNRMLKATGGIIHNHFIILVVDESKAGASGCSIDKSVRFVQFMEQEHQTQLFDRMMFSYIADQEVRFVRKEELAHLYESGAIDDETRFFDPLVNTKGEYLERWLVPFGQSWHKRMM